jgi:DNA-binding response OmpR family regulator
LEAQEQRTIAVIDDDGLIRNLIETILGAGGYRVVSTGDPTAAVAMVEREAPDLVLCDIAMPMMDGYQVLQALQANPETAHRPVMFLTAHREFSERVQAFRMGVVDYVAKPFTRDMLLKKIERVLQGLDRKAAAAPDAPASPGEAARLPGGTEGLPSFEALPEGLRSVLVVDDNALFRRFLRDLLQDRGFTVYQAASGEEGLEVALERRPWLILADVRMAGMDGFEFCRKVRAHALLRHAPLVFLSAQDDYTDRYKGLEAGADEFLSKGTPVRELLIRIQLLLGRFAELGAPSQQEPGMEGGIEVIGAPGFLQMCHLGGLSGVCLVRSQGRVFDVRFRSGQIVGAHSGVLRGADAVFDFLSWTDGRFFFTSGDPGPGTPIEMTFDQLLLEGCRRLDESRRR